MEPSINRIEASLGPASIYNSRLRSSRDSVSWEASYLNPKNRLGNVSSETSQDWEFFGMEILERRLYVVPKFAIGKPPLRIDAYLSEGIDLDSGLCMALGVQETIFASMSSIKSLQFTLHIMHALQQWSRRQQDFEAKYLRMPFGSCILIENLSSNVSSMTIHMLAIYDVERCWLSLDKLCEAWGLTQNIPQPLIDVTELQLQRQLHGAITVVSIAGEPDGRLYAFKATVCGAKYMYHELKLLLTIPPHPNIVSKPTYLVSKKCRFGGKLGICGFLLPYYPLGNMRDALRPDSTIRAKFDEYLCSRWAREIASALVHISGSSAGYYSDLKIDNVLVDLRDGIYHPVLIDFEQRGAWFSWSPPEINYPTYLLYMTHYHDRAKASAETSKYDNLVHLLVPGWKDTDVSAKYEDRIDGHNFAWTSLAPEERESATVFMFGKLLWCLFEAQSTVNSALWYGPEIFQQVNPALRFPEFRRTPTVIQNLISTCTAGAPEWQGHTSCVQLVGRMLFPSGSNGKSNILASTAEETQEVIRTWWEAEVQRAAEFANAKHIAKHTYKLMTRAHERPSLGDVFKILSDHEQEGQKRTIPTMPCSSLHGSYI